MRPAAEPVAVPSGGPETAPWAPSSWRAAAAAVLLVAGAFGVVLATVESAVFDLERFLAPKALVLHATALGLFALGFPSLRGARWGAMEWLLVAFVLWSAASAALASNRWLATGAFGIGLSSLVLLLAARELAPTLRWPVLTGFLAAAVLGAGLGVAQAYGAGWEWLADRRSPGGTFGNRNFLAHLSVLAIPPLAVATLRARPRWLPLALLGLATLAAAVVLTRSRAAWLGGLAGIGAAAAVLLAFASVRTRARARAALVLGGLAVAVGLAVLLPNRLRWTAESPYAETLVRIADYGAGSGRGRLIQYRHSLDLARESPVFGVGPGNWFVHYPRVTRPDDPSFAAHLAIPTNPWPSSDWVAFLTERGALGALLLVLAGVAAAGRALGRARSGEPDDAYAAAATAGLLVAALVAGFFDAVLLLAAPSFLVFATTGLLLPEPARGRAWLPARRTRRAVKAAAALLAVGVFAEAGSRTAAVAMTGERRDVETLQGALRVSPGDHRLLLLLAERGDCRAARRAALLLPHHPKVEGLLGACD